MVFKLIGLAVAEEMQRRGWDIHWIGTTRGMENKLVPPKGLPMTTLDFHGLRGKGLMHTLTGGLKLIKAFFSVKQIFKRVKPRVVLGMGGYVCYPVGKMAAQSGIPLMLVNADAALLMSNRALLPVAAKVAFGFDGPDVKKVSQALVTGNPVRQNIENMPPPVERYAHRQGPLRVLVVGGSLGARVLNDNLPRALSLMPQDQRPIVVHQTGVDNATAVKEQYRQLGLVESESLEVLPFIDDMAKRLADCDLIICRAGAITVSELCSAGIASILVPLVISTTSHQRDNASFMALHQAALHLPQTELTPERLAGLLSSLNRSQLLEMGTRARQLARHQAAARVADEIIQLDSIRQKGSAA